MEPAYMSPEQKDGLPATAQSDIYAVGLICFHMLTGIKNLSLPPARSIAVWIHLGQVHLGTLKEPSARCRCRRTCKVGVAIGVEPRDEGNRKSDHGVRLASPGKAASRLRGSLYQEKEQLIRRSSSYSRVLTHVKKVVLE